MTVADLGHAGKGTMIPIAGKLMVMKDAVHVYGFLCLCVCMCVFVLRTLQCKAHDLEMGVI